MHILLQALIPEVHHCNTPLCTVQYCSVKHCCTVLYGTVHSSACTLGKYQGLVLYGTECLCSCLQTVMVLPVLHIPGVE